MFPNFNIDLKVMLDVTMVQQMSLINQVKLKANSVLLKNGGEGNFHHC
jgi:hypothetical protein